MRIVRYVTRDSQGNEYLSVKAYAFHGQRTFDGSHILEDPETGSLLATRAAVVDLDQAEIDDVFSAETRCRLDPAED